MKVRKSLAVVGAALMMIGANAYADKPAVYCGIDDMNPDPVDITNSLKDLADYLSTKDRLDDPNFPVKNFGPWPYDPIWQKRGGGSFEVQNALTKKLYEYRTADTKPPKNRNNDAAGAAWDVRNGKYDAAVDKLLSFRKDVYKSKLNPWTEGNDDFVNEADAKKFFVNEVNIAIGCVCKLTECNF